MSARDRVMSVYRKEIPGQRTVAIYARYLPRGSAERRARDLGLAILDYYPIVSMLAPPWHLHSGYLSEVHGADFRIAYSWENGCRIETRTYQTPLGSVSQRIRKDPSYDSDWIEQHYVRQIEDYRIIQYLVENTVLKDNTAGYIARRDDLGEDGVVIARVDRSPFQKALIELAGPERFLLDLQTEPAPVLALMQALDRKMDEVFELVCKSPAEVVWQPDNISCDMTPPKYFERFCLPYYAQHAGQLHQQRKLFLVHMDGRLKAIRDMIAASPIDAVESFSLPEIGGDMTLTEAKATWPSKLVLPNFPSSLATQDEKKIVAFVERLSREAGPDTPLMLQVSEDIPAGVWRRLLPVLCDALYVDPRLSPTSDQ